MPVTSPEHPWDRLRISVIQEHVGSNDPQLHLPLPEGVHDGTQYLGTILIYAIDILLGQLPANVLRHWLAPQVYNVLLRRASLAYRIYGKADYPHRPRVSRIMYSRPQPRVLEIAATMYDGKRIRPVGMRMEFLKKHWRVVALDIG